MVKIPEFCSMGGARSKKNHFLHFLHTAYRKQFYPKPMAPMENRDSVCLLLVWRVCDQAFGRYRPLKDAYVILRKM